MQGLEERLGHRFQDLRLLATALAHPSWAHEHDAGRGNERLEFLGDAVLELAVAELLYALHPDWHEGELTRVRASLVNARVLAEQARTLGLGPHLQLGRSERASGGAGKGRILADAFEAVLGAIYLDGGFAPARALVERLFGEALRRPAPAPSDAKTRLNEWAQLARGAVPVYLLQGDSGRDDDPLRFEVEVTVAAQALGRARGRTKREAEQVAAAAALRAVEETG